MGMIGRIFDVMFGGSRNVVRETVEVFRENAEHGAARAQETQTAAMAQFGAEFRPRSRGRFDRFMDGVNRLPRPMMAMGCLALLIAAMVEPVWFSVRMQGLSLVPEPLWWLLGVVVSFYFGARHQVKGQEFQHSIAATMAHAPEVVSNIRTLRKLNKVEGVDSSELAKPENPIEDNAALQEWRQMLK